MPKWCCSLLVIVATGWILQQYFVWNTTPSLPQGLYFKTWREPQLGDIVLVCPPDMPVFRAALERRFLSPGLCPAGTGLIIKVLAAMAGDHVRTDAFGVTVNGQLLPGSSRQAFGLDPVPDWSRTLREGEVLLMTPHPKSFDARYFGSLNRDTITTPLQPLWVKE